MTAQIIRKFFKVPFNEISITPCKGIRIPRLEFQFFSLEFGF